MTVCFEDTGVPEVDEIINRLYYVSNYFHNTESWDSGSTYLYNGGTSKLSGIYSRVF